MSRYYCACGGCEGRTVETYDAAFENHHVSSSDCAKPSLIMAIVKSSNPKDIAGTTRAPLHALPVAASPKRRSRCSRAFAAERTTGRSRACVRLFTLRLQRGTRSNGSSVSSATKLRKCTISRPHACLVYCSMRSSGKYQRRPPASLNKLDELFSNAENGRRICFTLYGDAKPKHYTIETARPSCCVLKYSACRLACGTLITKDTE